MDLIKYLTRENLEGFFESMVNCNRFFMIVKYSKNSIMSGPHWIAWCVQDKLRKRYVE